MLPARQQKTTYDGARGTEQQIKPGSWWRLVSEEHALREYPAPDHGLALMVQEVRIIDGEIHTIVLHPHPTWRGHRPRGLKLLCEEFLKTFTPEPEGEALREAEIASVMGRVQAISNEMKTPPDPVLLLERQKESEESEPSSTRPDSVEPSLPATTGSTQVPAALLPSRDVVEAQKMIETRIAAFEAQKNWITGKTDELKSEMDLVAAYQMEKVNTTLASISEETTRAEGLLQNVQTMRLFLGEDMAITPLLDGKGADASEPLTLMQRMLYLDEEIIINDLLEGFSDDQMDPENLTEIFTKDFSLVERMLPYPRCAAIVRVRRNQREFNTEGMSIAQLFEVLDIAKADMRVHILVRDGERLSMITADETTSGAQRFFPSRAEIDALFKTRSYFGQDSTEILPDNVEYSDARAEHDKRALFYKRFLILMWGVHERTNAFGPFMPKGGNWLSLTTHSERFRFVHDEEEVLSDGRPSISEFVSAANDAMTHGSRVIAYWNRAIDGSNAPAIAEESDYRRSWKVGIDLVENISLSMVQAEGATLVARARVQQGGWRKKPRTFDAKVTIKRPTRTRHARPDSLLDHWIADGVLCLDTVTLEDIDYYANSRAAREAYLRYAHLLVAARKVLHEERQTALALVDELRAAGFAFEDAYMTRALRLWRSANKWGWPEKESQRKALATLAARLADEDEIRTFVEGEADMLWGGLRANGDVFVVSDTVRASLPDGTALPWLEEKVVANIRTGRVKRQATRTWTENSALGELTLVRSESRCAAFLARCAPPQEITTGGIMKSNQRKETIHGWRCPRGLFDASNREAFVDAGRATGMAKMAEALIDNSRPELLQELLGAVFEGYQAPNNKIEHPTLKGSLALAWAIDYDLMPKAWVVNVEIDILELAALHGEEDQLYAHLERIYAQPKKKLERTLENPRPVRVYARPLGFANNLAKVWQSEPCLSFDSVESRLAIYEDHLRNRPEIGWKEVLGSTFAEKDGSFGKSPFSYRGASVESVLDASSRIGVVASPAAEAVLPRLYEMSRKG